MNTPVDVHTRCVDALPQWLAGTLAADEAARLAEHVRVCTDCRGELDVARRVRAQFEREWRAVAPLLDAERAATRFDQLWAQITATEPPPKRRASLRERLPLLTALAATVLIGAGIAWYRDATQPDFRTLSDQPPRRCTALRVEVDAAPSAALRRALEATGATIIDARSAGDIYVLTAPNPADALQALRALPDVRLAEPVDC
jgi:hypothetical protein